ncbi:MAG: NAD(P)-binding domain-containing protein, partial [Myxococcota bacterium]
RFEVTPRLRLGTRVQSVTPMAGERPWANGLGEPTHWCVESTGPDGERFVTEYDAVAVCNGHYARPHVPDLPGLKLFRGQAMHSHSYRRPERFSGMRVALLGARASGVDLTVEIARHASQVWLCDRDATGTERFAGLEHAERRSAIARIASAGNLVLEDGSAIEAVDVLIFCTGYEFSFPFLQDADGIFSFDESGVHPLYFDLVAARASTLAFIGLPSRIVPFPLFELQARFFAQTLVGTLELPDAAGREAAADRRVEALHAEGIARRHVLTYGDRQFAYCDRLADATGTPRLPPDFEALYRVVEAARSQNVLGYRDASYP